MLLLFVVVNFLHQVPLLLLPHLVELRHQGILVFLLCRLFLVVLDPLLQPGFS